jgi:hypothetical protein
MEMFIFKMRINVFDIVPYVGISVISFQMLNILQLVTLCFSIYWWNSRSVE